MGSLPTIRQGSTAILNKHKGARLGPATVLAQEMGRSQEQHEEARGTVWIVVQGRLLLCALEHLRHLSERGSLSIDRDKGGKDRARTFTNIVQDFRFSKGAHVDLRSQCDPPDGTEPRHLSGKIFVRTPTETPGSSSSGTRTETRLVVEPTVIPSATNLENPMPAMHDSSEPTPVPGTDETQDRESPDMETYDPDTTATVPEPHPTAVVHERSVRPRIELPDEDELFVHSQLQSSGEQVKEHVSDHGVDGIGVHTVFAKSVGENLKTTSNSHLTCHGTIWKDFKQNRIPHVISSLQQFAKVQR